MTVDRRSSGVAVAGFCTFLNVYMPQAILPSIAAAFGIPLPRTGLAITVTLLAVAVVAPFVGSISDRVGRKRLIVGAAASLAIPTLLLGAAPNFETLLVLRFVQGLLFPFIFAVTVAYIADECAGPDGIRAAGTYSVGTIFGGFLGRAIAGAVADLAGWRVAFAVVGSACLVGAMFIARVMPSERNFAPMRGGIGAALRTYAEHLANARLMATCAIGFGMLFTQVAAFTYVNFYLAAPPFGLGEGQLAGVFAVYLLGMTTPPIASRLAIRIGRLPTLAAALSMAAVGLAATLVPALPAVIAGLALLCGGLFVTQSLSLGFAGVVVRRGKSAAVGLYVTIFYVGGALGGIVPGPLWHRFGWPGVIALLLGALALMVCAGAAAFGGMSRVPRS